MSRANLSDQKPRTNYRLSCRWIVPMACAAGLVLGLLIFRARHDRISRDPTNSDSRALNSPLEAATAQPKLRPLSRSEHLSSPELSAEEIVTRKVAQFGRKRRELVRSIAQRSQKEIPPEIEKFFDAVESGQWDDITNQWHELAVHSGQYTYSTNHWEHLDPFWPAVLDAYGVAEQAHLWPPQKLLDYGNSILGALRPGMVYVGGTDNGRWIPELLNDTSDGEQHIIVTQNAFADSRYLDFVNNLYGDRLQALTMDDSQRAFQDYVTDAQKRFEHDQQFPDEPRQVRPAEDIQMVDGKVQVRGQVAVMAINEKLLETLMQKNPEMSFAIQESFPLRRTYPDALPLGPLMELNARSDQNTFTPDLATQSLDYWRNATQQVLGDFDTTGSDAALKSYAHDAVTAANLLAAHDFGAQAEEIYRLATQIWPSSPETVADLANLLATTGRKAEAQQLLDTFSSRYPDESKAVEKMASGWGVVSKP